MGTAGVAQEVAHDTATVTEKTGHVTATVAEDIGHATDAQERRPRKLPQPLAKGQDTWGKGHQEDCPRG